MSDASTREPVVGNGQSTGHDGVVSENPYAPDAEPPVPGPPAPESPPTYPATSSEPPPVAYPPVAYPAAYPYPTPAALTEPMAIWALICGIGCWVVMPIVLAVVALILAKQADEAITAASGAKSGAGMVTAARWLAWIQLILAALVVVFVAALLVGLAIGS